MKNEMRGTIYIQVALRARNAFPFKNTVMGFAEFSVNGWQPAIFEFPYVKGSSQQTITDVLDAAVKALHDFYGQSNVKLQCFFDSWDGEKIPIV